MKNKIYYETQTDENSPTDFFYSISSKKTNFYDSSTGGIASALCPFFHIIPFQFFIEYLLCATPRWRPGISPLQTWGPNPVYCLVFINKVYWNTATLFHLRAVRGCLLAELRSWDRNHLACKAKILSGHFQKKCVEPTLDREDTVVNKNNQVPKCLQTLLFLRLQWRKRLLPRGQPKPDPRDHPPCHCYGACKERENGRQVWRQMCKRRWERGSAGKVD